MTQQLPPGVPPDISPAALECWRATQLVKSGQAAEGVQMLLQLQQQGYHAAGFRLGELYKDGVGGQDVRDRNGRIVLKRSISDARRAYEWAKARSKNRPRALRRIEAELESLPKDIAPTIEGSYHNIYEGTETNTTAPVIEPPSKTLLEKTTALLAEEGIAEPQRPALAQAATRLIDMARTDPEATLTGMNNAVSTIATQLEAIPPKWQEKVAPEGPPTKQKGGRKRKDLPPTEADLKKARGGGRN